MPKTSIETLCSSLLYLLSCQAQKPDAKLQRSICDHFYWISTHPHIQTYPILEQTTTRLLSNWNLPGEQKFIGDISSSRTQ